jgi:hypothetical protein
VTRFTQVYPDFAVFFVEFYADLDTNALFWESFRHFIFQRKINTLRHHTHTRVSG